MASDNKDDYVFNRSYLDNVRINLQHYLICQTFGYHIHPSIPTTNPTMRIADVGTGTGIWLTDVSDRLPKSVTLDGLDISFDACPRKEWLPPNMTLHQWDIKSEVPEHLVGVYDLVSVRHFAFVLQEHELQETVDKLFRLLKPGGYLQWTDIDVSSQGIEKISPDVNAEPQERIMSMFRGGDARLSTSWVPSLDSRFRDAGATNVEVDRKVPPHHLGHWLFETGFLAVEALTRNSAIDEEKSSKIQASLRDSVAATREGSYAGFTRYTVIGQKRGEAVA
ncbi:S-adenosyl-L-methionine-dependent methyltransferase [Aspergillus heterothallicus]